MICVVYCFFELYRRTQVMHMSSFNHLLKMISFLYLSPLCYPTKYYHDDDLDLMLIVLGRQLKMNISKNRLFLISNILVCLILGSRSRPSSIGNDTK